MSERINQIEIKTLSRGDKVHIVAPSGKVDIPKIKAAIVQVGSWGLIPEVHPQVFERAGYFAGSDSKRHDSLQSALDDSEAKAIFCARGGYGLTRILDGLDFEMFLKNPKWVIGFSDVTALLTHIQLLGFPCIHACMPIQFSSPDHAQSVVALRDLLFGARTEIRWGNESSNQAGKVKGELTGGNLSLLVDSLSTKSELDTKGKILFIEEINEDIYKVDRMMNQLKRSRKLEEIRGLVVGQMTNIRDTSPPFGDSVSELISNKVSNSIPISFGFSGGHDAPNLPLIMGAEYLFEVKKTGASLSFVP